MGIKNMEILDDDYMIQTVEILKRPGQTLGFYIREGNGSDRTTGVFISRIGQGSVVENNGLLRVGDEIITVNSVNVSRMSLDDVVILMSIPKRLVLTIRTLRNYSKNASCPSLCPEPEEPVVVVKKGRSGSTTAVEMTEKCPDEFISPGEEGRSYYSRAPTGQAQHRISKGRPPPPPPYKQSDKHAYGAGDDSGDSGLSSENSGYSARGDVHGTGIIMGQHAIPGHPALTTTAQYHSGLYNYAVDGINALHIDTSHRENSPKLSPRELAMTTFRPQRSPRRNPEVVESSPYVPIDYSSDTEVRRYLAHHGRSLSASDHPVASMGSRHYDMNSVRAFQDEIERTHSHYESQGGYLTSTSSRIAKPGLKTRSMSPDCYNSDSEVMFSRKPGKHLPQLPMSVREAAIARMMDDERSNSLPRMDSDGKEEVKQWLRKYDALNYGLQQAKTAAAIAVQQQAHQDEILANMAIQSNAGGYMSNSYSKDIYENSRDLSGYTSDDYYSTYGNRINPKYMSRSLEGRHHPRVVRKLSADSLLDYRTYQMEDPLENDSQYAPIIPIGSNGKISHSYSSTGSLSGGSAAPVITNKVPRQIYDMEGKSLPAPTSRGRDLQLARTPMQVRIEDFRPYKPEQEHKKVPFPERTMDGEILMHVLCGHGLKSSRTMLRDLYCVIEVNNVNKARTMIRTGAINFDWDEIFDIDLEGARELSFLIYSWDPNTRHRLCFSGIIVLQAFIQYGSRQKVALKLEPKGVLYLDISYREPAVSIRRAPSLRKTAIFGVDLSVMMKNDKSGLNVPLVVRRCIKEVEKRGLDHIGIYRLCGSARRKAQLKEELERNVKATDLSQDNISDINVITGVLKDFLRELPEPLFTNALYQMLLDALTVRLPSDPDGSAKLMLSILECLPKANQETLAYLMDHLKLVCSKAEVNKMTTHNLAVIFGPVLLCPSPQAVSDLDPGAMDFRKHIEVLHYLLEIWPDNRDVNIPLHKITFNPMPAYLRGVPTGSESNGPVRGAAEGSGASWEGETPP